MDGEVVAREGARLREALVAEVASERPDVCVAPVVHDQACALLEYLVAVLELAAEEGLHSVVEFVDLLKALVGVRWHGFDARVGLLRFYIFAHRVHRGIWHRVELLLVRVAVFAVAIGLVRPLAAVSYRAVALDFELVFSSLLHLHSVILTDLGIEFCPERFISASIQQDCLLLIRFL